MKHIKKSIVAGCGIGYVLSKMSDENKERARNFWEDHKEAIVAVGVSVPLAAVGASKYTRRQWDVDHVTSMQNMTFEHYGDAFRVVMKNGRSKVFAV